MECFGNKTRKFPSLLTFRCLLPYLLPKLHHEPAPYKEDGHKNEHGDRRLVVSALKVMLPIRYVCIIILPTPKVKPFNQSFMLHHDEDIPNDGDSKNDEQYFLHTSIVGIGNICPLSKSHTTKNVRTMLNSCPTTYRTTGFPPCT